MRKSKSKGLLSCALALALLVSLLCGLPVWAADVQLSAQNLTVNGVEIACEKYNIDGFNYFKLRDLAYLLSGTQAQFSVGWDDATQTIILTSGQPYTPVGGELEPQGDRSDTAIFSSQTVIIDGERVGFEAYNINDNNYFKLRDLGKTFGFAVDHIGETNTATVDSPVLGGASGVTLSLKYKGGGHTDDPVSLNWYIGPQAVSTSPCGDIDGDGKPEIIFAVRSIYCMDAATGVVKWMTPYGYDTSETDASDSDARAIASQYVPNQIVDVDGDGMQEAVVFGSHPDTQKGYIAVYDGNGRFKIPLIELPYPIGAAKLADVDNDGRLEIAVLLSVGEGNRYGGVPAFYVFDSYGNLCSGFPQEFGYGTYGNSVEAVDLDGDGTLEWVMLGDQAFMTAFHTDGSKAVISSGVFAGKTWEITDFESYEFTQKIARNEVHNYGTDRGEHYTMMGSRSGIVAVDVDGDGTKELVITMLVNDEKLNDDIMGDRPMMPEDMIEGGIAKYFSTYILNLDHSRYVNEALGFDWTAWPLDVGEILTYDNFFVLSNPDISPTVADLDGDGLMEILYSSYDGMVHCFSLDGTEHDAWPFNMNAGGGVMTMASKPVAADINGDGYQEVIFSTYTAMDQMETLGRLYVVDRNGSVLAEQELPHGWGNNGDGGYGYPNGGEGTPVLADVDNDGALEIIVTTRNCGVCVYDIG